MVESAMELQGVLVATHEEGALLGEVRAIRIDPELKTLTALTVRTRKGPDKDVVINVGDVERVGEDIILIRSRAAARPYASEDALPGKSLKSLQGCWVTTMDGTHLGTLVDVDFSTSDWRITELELAEHKSLAVDPSEMKIGDEILVPSSYANQVEEMPREKYGAMGRLLGGERIDDLRETLNRVLRRAKDTSDDDSADGT